MVNCNCEAARRPADSLSIKTPVVPFWSFLKTPLQFPGNEYSFPIELTKMPLDDLTPPDTSSLTAGVEVPMPTLPLATE